MKIGPPKVVIDKDEPFGYALFEREEVGQSLTHLIRNVSENLVVFVNAPWGEGKTTFSQMWCAELRRQKLEVIYFDAFAADYFDDPFICFSGEILAFADKMLSEGKALFERQEFKETAVEVGKRLAGLAVKVGLRAASLGAVESAHVDALKDIAKGISEIGADIIEKKIENYSIQKDSLKQFKASLAKVAGKIREEQGFPLTIIVDELDRCRPDFALALLERIKHLFDVEGVTFVLLVSRKQIESYIKVVYGDVDASAYLLKFGNLFVDLPCRESILSKGDSRKDYCQNLISHHGISGKVKNSGLLIQSMWFSIDHFNLTLREIERAFAIMTVYYASLPANQVTNEFLISLLSVLKIKNVELYSSLALGRVSPECFFQKTGILEKVSNAISGEWAKNIIDYCLMSDSEFRGTVDGRTGGRRADLLHIAYQFGPGDLERAKIIPFLCNRLDRFSAPS
jgi:hypothetical protein